MNRFARKIDGNQGVIIAALRKIGVQVIDMSRAGSGMTDLICFYRGFTYPCEVKNGLKTPSQKCLTADQIKFHDTARAAGVMIPIFESVNDALRFFGAPVE